MVATDDAGGSDVMITTTSLTGLSFIQSRVSEVERTALRDFLYQEARLLDTQNPKAWLDLLASDIHYYMPSQPSLYRRQLEKTSTQKKLALYDDNLDMLQRRITRMIHPTAWSEDPPNRTVRQVTNIEVLKQVDAGPEKSWEVFSCIAIYRSRNESDHDLIFARRKDLICLQPEGLRLSKRNITLSQNTLLSKNLNVIF